MPTVNLPYFVSDLGGYIENMSTGSTEPVATAVYFSDRLKRVQIYNGVIRAVGKEDQPLQGVRGAWRALGLFGGLFPHVDVVSSSRRIRVRSADVADGREGLRQFAAAVEDAIAGRPVSSYSNAAVLPGGSVPGAHRRKTFALRVGAGLAAFGVGVVGFWAVGSSTWFASRERQVDYEFPFVALRAGPAEASRVLAEIVSGDQITLLDGDLGKKPEATGWVRVEWEGRQGWVLEKRLQAVGARAAAPPDPSLLKLDGQWYSPERGDAVTLVAGVGKSHRPVQNSDVRNPIVLRLLSDGGGNYRGEYRVGSEWVRITGVFDQGVGTMTLRRSDSNTVWTVIPVAPATVEVPIQIRDERLANGRLTARMRRIDDRVSLKFNEQRFEGVWGLRGYRIEGEASGSARTDTKSAGDTGLIDLTPFKEPTGVNHLEVELYNDACCEASLVIELFIDGRAIFRQAYFSTDAGVGKKYSRDVQLLGN